MFELSTLQDLLPPLYNTVSGAECMGPSSDGGRGGGGGALWGMGKWGEHEVELEKGVEGREVETAVYSIKVGIDDVNLGPAYWGPVPRRVYYLGYVPRRVYYLGYVPRQVYYLGYVPR